MKNDTKKIDFMSVIIIALLAIISAMGAGITVKNVLHDFGGWVVAGYGIIAGIFISLFLIILIFAYSSLKEE